jgi:hypothetical protein
MAGEQPSSTVRRRANAIVKRLPVSTTCWELVPNSTASRPSTSRPSIDTVPSPATQWAANVR